VAVALLVAAGTGERLGYGRPKALVPVAGRPMLEWSLDALRAVDEVDEVVVALPAGALDAAPADVTVVAGGAVRSASVRSALSAAGGGDAVIVHDAARPLAEAVLFRRALAVLRETGADAVVAAVPVSDTIKEVGADGGAVTRTLPRDRLWAVQTPQVFRRSALAAALGEASDELLARATDDAWLVEQRGGTVRVVEGSHQNLKVTTPLDLRVAELILRERAP
jgi:2-C-methyl-D-erythritol 4-phosphate cytidylyltransferase